MISQLNAAFLRVAAEDELHGQNVAGYSTYGLIEGIAHELAHRCDLGKSFENRLRRMGDCAANSHEATTLRIEITALQLLGVRLSLRRLWSTANWRNRGPLFQQLQRPLNLHERRCVRKFLDRVRAASM